MSSSNLIRWSGLVGVLGGALAILVDIAQIARFASAAWVNPVLIVFTSLVLFALMGLYARQSERAGVLGLVGFVVSVVGVALSLSLFFAFTLIIPSLQEQFPDAYQAIAEGPFGRGFQWTFLLSDLGFVLFGLATWRAGVLPRWGALLLIIGPILSGSRFVLPTVLGPIGDMLLGGGLAWLGYALWSGMGERAAQLQPGTR